MAMGMVTWALPFAALPPPAKTLPSCGPLPKRSFNGNISISRSSNAAVRRSRSFSVKAMNAKVADVTKVVPREDRVLVRLEELPEASEGGVLLPKSAVKFERYLVGEVIAVGSKAEAAVQKGQKVMFSDVNGYEVNFGTSDRFCFCDVGNLLGVVQ